MIKRLVRVTQVVEVEVNEKQFTPNFLHEFHDSLYPFNTVDEHIVHLGQLCARGLLTDFADCFVEGYGTAADMGIRLRVMDDQTEIEIVSPDPPR